MRHLERKLPYTSGFRSLLWQHWLRRFHLRTLVVYGRRTENRAPTQTLNVMFSYNLTIT